MYSKYSILILFFLLFSCNEDIEDCEIEDRILDVSELSSYEIPRNFNFNTTETINVNVDVKSIYGIPLSGVKVSFYSSNPDFGGRHISSAFTSLSGSINLPILIPTYQEDLFVQVHSKGFANQRSKSVDQNMYFSFGGIPEERTKENLKDPSLIPISDKYFYMGPYSSGTSEGLPDYIESEGDNLSQSFLNSVMASLPNQSVSVVNPEYLTIGNELDIVIVDQSDIWITFVSEGAGYSNALGYYVFDTGNPPITAAEIDSVFVILPNTSLANSGGQLNAGDKVKLGAFPAGKTISWVLFQNAWSDNGIDVNVTKFYSRIDFNTMENDASKRQHTIQLSDFDNELLLVGFEDQIRSVASNEDFNDLIFYVTSNSWGGISTASIPRAIVNVDTDGDGVSDRDDDFPDDQLRALRNTYAGALAYEDLWPAEGDYDFNDLVMDYEIDHILNASNLLVDIEADWIIRGVFASFSNGFGIQFDNLSSSDISGVSGAMLNNNLVTLNSNGTEANQSKASIIFFDNVFDVVSSSGSSFPHTSPVSTMRNVINFTSPISQSLVGFPPYNSYIFVDGQRDKEVHLPGHYPTDLASSQYFGFASDATDVSTDFYYKTSNGFPWAINFPETFHFPRSGVPIFEAYYFFLNWSLSGGVSHKNWYQSENGNRDLSKIYN
jgi:LruC domain-containing protein